MSTSSDKGALYLGQQQAGLLADMLTEGDDTFHEDDLLGMSLVPSFETRQIIYALTEKGLIEVVPFMGREYRLTKAGKLCAEASLLLRASA